MVEYDGSPCGLPVLVTLPLRLEGIEILSHRLMHKKWAVLEDYGCSRNKDFLKILCCIFYSEHICGVLWGGGGGGGGGYWLP